MKMALVMIKTAAMLSKALPRPGGAPSKHLNNPLPGAVKELRTKLDSGVSGRKDISDCVLTKHTAEWPIFKHMMHLKARLYGTHTEHQTIVNNYNTTQHECLNGIRREHKCTNAIQHVPTQQQHNGNFQLMSTGILDIPNNTVPTMSSFKVVHLASRF